MSTSRRQKAAQRREKTQNKAGSQQFSEPEFLLVGSIRKPHGVKGEVQLGIQTDFPERIQKGCVYYMGHDRQAVKIASVRPMNDGLIVKFEEFTNREEVEFLRNKGLYIPVSELPPLPDNELYLHQLLGLKAISEEGLQLGQVVDFIETGANNVLVLRTEDEQEILLPDTDEVILKIDLKAKTILVHLLPGLLPEP